MSYNILIMMLILICLVYISFLYFAFKNLLHKLKYYKILAFSVSILIVFYIVYNRNILFLILNYIILFFILIYIFLFMLTDLSKIKFNNIYKVSIVISSIITIFVTIFGYYNASNIIRTEYSINSPKNIKENYKIGLISDVHFNNNSKKNNIIATLNSINNEELDILILAGDIVDETTTISEYFEIFNVISKINTKYGIYYIYGNHDDSQLNKNESKSKSLKKAINDNSIIILNDETKIINNDFYLTGRLDYSYENTISRKSSDELIKYLDKNNLLLIADHQPNKYQTNKKSGFDIQVSGHTHAGQIWPLGLVTQSLGFDYGLLKEDNFNLVVSSGLGTWGFPVRTEKNSEYVIININKNSN